MRKNSGKKYIALIVVFALCAALVSCGGASKGSNTGAAPGDTAAAQDVVEQTSLAEGGTELELPQDGRKRIMNAQLSIEALDFDTTLETLCQAAEQAGGYVSSTHVEGQAEMGGRYAEYEFRIPAEKYSAFLMAADGAGNVTQKSESVQDVTAQYVDVEARLSSLETQRESITRMLEQSQDVETLLAIQRELADIQYEIESYTAQKRTYDDQVAYSTVQISVYEVRRVTEAPQSFASRLGSAFRSGWYGLGQGLQGIAVAFAAILPALMVLACVVFIIWALVVRVMMRRKSKK